MINILNQAFINRTASEVGGALQKKEQPGGNSFNSILNEQIKDNRSDVREISADKKESSMEKPDSSITKSNESEELERESEKRKAELEASKRNIYQNEKITKTEKNKKHDDLTSIDIISASELFARTTEVKAEISKPGKNSTRDEIQLKHRHTDSPKIINIEKKEATEPGSGIMEMMSSLRSFLSQIKTDSRQLSSIKEIKDESEKFDKLKLKLDDKDSASFIRQLFSKMKTAIDKLPDTADDKSKIKDGFAALTENFKKIEKKIQPKTENVLNTKLQEIFTHAVPAAEKAGEVFESGSIKSRQTQVDNNSQPSYNPYTIRHETGIKKLESSSSWQKNSLFDEKFQSIIDNAKIVVRDGKNGSFTLKLNPEELGSVKINIGLEEGVVKAKFIVDNEQAKEALQHNIRSIMEELENSGVAVGEFQVNVSGEQMPFAWNDENNQTSIKSFSDSAITAEYEYISEMSHEGSLNLVV